MITSSSISYISQLLNEPGLLSEPDNENIAAIREAFPYFIPARYLEAAGIHKTQPFAPAIMNTMPLYTGNWLLYNYFLQSAQSNKYTAPVAEEEEEPEVVAPEENFDTDPTYITAEEVPEPQMPEPEPEPEQEYINFNTEPVIVTAETNDTLILPIYTEDYFFHQGMQVSNDIPADIDQTKNKPKEDKSLMVMMSFSEWLLHFKKTTDREKEEKEDKKALKAMWQKEKLAAIMEEEDDEIPESVFEMAVNSITREDDLFSESLADIYIKQGKYDKAVEMYRKLSLKNPQKNAYFAHKIDALLKEK
jgi:tetratricopeptide (TPR) repeat protein